MQQLKRRRTVRRALGALAGAVVAVAGITVALPALAAETGTLVTAQAPSSATGAID
ncbi:hypothetical protein [Georgenia sp. SYP-B2076]|uniref:hypothetical protein n=1 Tax=Georgenia sp. SYP-B2076 TaxID=2495881 RepID=UPI0013DFFA4F|nr:hypothetical protein [Georgenia sp. SYP-B2076]